MKCYWINETVKNNKHFMVLRLTRGKKKQGRFVYAMKDVQKRSLKRSGKKLLFSDNQIKSRIHTKTHLDTIRYY